MLKIRFLRTGRKNDPNFRLVVTDSKKAPRSGAYVETLGSYVPKIHKFQFKAERINHWLNVGAQLSDTAHNLLLKNKVILNKKNSQ